MNIRQFLQRRYVGSSVALVAGASLTLSFSPFGWWPVAILAPALLMWMWDGANPRRAGGRREENLLLIVERGAGLIFCREQFAVGAGRARWLLL